MMSKTNSELELVDTNTLSKKINLTPGQIAIYRRKGLIPYIGLSRKMIRYRVKDVEAALVQLSQRGVAQ